jgi:hypothetical protein
MKYYYYCSWVYEYFKNELMIDGVILFLHRISTPIRLKTILHIVQLMAFLTSNSLSNNNSFIPFNASSISILCSPETELNSNPNNNVAYLLILTTLQCKYAAAIPTSSCLIMLPWFLQISTFFGLVRCQLIEYDERTCIFLSR